ncbi:SURF1 family protein [Frondihabitans australicus]|uniref:SURF1-like protein n=1 Tax=Frondihabitans australicus TaxID=386892 RepID=A0A495IFQ4_9MICO|nr:SURF1 family protein [Frondihabitans australicus]RKR74171.1 cytochrome oxidase assembly protein ShyY1 [Frondihabitans australicus]
MREWRFVLSKKWLGYLGIAVAFAIICVLLSHWQWDRRSENLALQDKLDANYNAKPVSIDSVLPTLHSYDSSDEFKPLRLTGHYLTSKTYLARDISYNGYPGFDVLVPLQLASGRVFIIDRGWVATGNDHDYPDSIPTPPKGEVTVVARLAPAQGDVPGRTDPKGVNEVARIQPADIAKKTGLTAYTAAYGKLKSETPSPGAANLPKPALKPQVDWSLNLSYAIQWVMFALAAFGFLIYVIRQEYDARYSDEEDQRWLEEERERKRQKRGPTDADIEDHELDEAGYSSSRPGTMIGR